MTPNPKPTHGGRREGAGRKTLYDEKMITVTIRLPPLYVNMLRSLGDGNASLGVRNLIEAANRFERS